MGRSKHSAGQWNIALDSGYKAGNPKKAKKAVKKRHTSPKESFRDNLKKINNKKIYAA